MIQGTSAKLDTQYTEFQKPSFAIDDPSLEYYALSRDSEGIKKTSSSVQDFCTIYGSQNPFEDFSECFNLYINHHDYFIHIMSESDILRKKYEYINRRIRQGEKSYNIDISYNTTPLHRYRDSTKIYIPRIAINKL